MSLPRTTPKGQTWMLQVMRKRTRFRRDLPLEQDKGICNGVATLGRDFIIRDEFDKFRANLQAIHSIFLNEQVDETAGRNIDRFFTNAELVNRWYRYRHLFADKGLDMKKRQQRIQEKITPNGVPAELQTVEVHHVLAVYRDTEIPIYVRELCRWAENSSSMTDPVTFMLHCDEHAIIFGYIPKKKSWHFVNANRTSKLDIHNQDKLIKWIVKAFERKKSMAIQTSFATTKQQSMRFNELLADLNCSQQWVELHDILNQVCRNDDVGTSCLHLAADAGDEKIIAQLLEAGADAHAREKRKFETALHIAAHNGFLDVVKKLISYDKSNINYQNILGETALFIAVACCYTDVAIFLLESGADPNIVPNNGFSLLLEATRLNDSRVVGLLVKKYEVNPNATYMDTNGIKRSALYLAVEKGSMNCIDPLVIAGANLDEEFDELLALAERKKSDAQTKINYTNVIELLKDLQGRCDTSNGQLGDQSPRKHALLKK